MRKFPEHGELIDNGNGEWQEFSDDEGSGNGDGQGIGYIPGSGLGDGHGYDDFDEYPLYGDGWELYPTELIQFWK